MRKNQNKFNNIYGSGTMRTGASLVCNLLSVHKDVIILTNVFHFFRHIYKRYRPLYKKSNLYKLSGELSIRLKYRNNLSISRELFFKDLIKQKPRKYSDLYNCLIQTFLSQIPEKKIIGEYANGEWRKIKTFLDFDKKNIAFQVLRDPRGMLSSWKKITFNKGYKYLNSIFNWIDAVDCAIHYKKMYGPKRFLLIKFEDVHMNPKIFSKKLCNFLKIKLDKNMLATERWKNLLSSNFIHINTSAYTNKIVYGFSVKRTASWKKNLTDWEVALIEYLCASRMKKIGYKIFKRNPKLYKKGLAIMNRDALLKKRLKFLLTKNRGTHEKLNDPSNPLNWETGKTLRKKFFHTSGYTAYKNEIELVHRESKNIN